MGKLEHSLLDKFVNGAFLGKRQIGRPLKYNIRNNGYQGMVELVFNPKNRLEQYVSNAMRFMHPYLNFITYRFHVEKAREAGKYLSKKPSTYLHVTFRPSAACKLFNLIL